MGIREKFRRSARKSLSSSMADLAIITSGASSPTSTAPSSGASTPERSKSPSRLAKTLTWASAKSSGGASSEEEEKKRERKRREKAARDRRRLHPSERPLTETNLRYQQMLSGFTMTFGDDDHPRRHRGSFGAMSGISPRGSIDASSPGYYAPY